MPLAFVCEEMSVHSSILGHQDPGLCLVSNLQCWLLRLQPIGITFPLGREQQGTATQTTGRYPWQGQRAIRSSQSSEYTRLLSQKQVCMLSDSFPEAGNFSIALSSSFTNGLPKNAVSSAPCENELLTITLYNYGKPILSKTI